MKISCYVLAGCLIFAVGCGTSSVTNDSVATDTSTKSDVLPTEDVAESSAGSDDEPASPQEQFENIKQQYEDEYQAFIKAYRAADDDAGKQSAMELRPKPEAFTDRLLALADSHPDTEAAVDALVWASRNIRGTAGEGATQKLVESYCSNPKVAAVAMMMKYSRGDGVEGQLYDLLKSESRQVQAAAKYSLGSILIGEDDTADEALALLQSVVDDYADVEVSFGTRTMKIAPQAEGEITEATKLQIGMVAPEIEGADLDGVDFKLSDYRGKVVVLDFWGNW